MTELVQRLRRYIGGDLATTPMLMIVSPFFIDGSGQMCSTTPATGARASSWGELSCSDISQEAIERFVLERRRCSSHTANKEIRYLRATFNFGKKRPPIDVNPRVQAPEHFAGVAGGVM